MEEPYKSDSNDFSDKFMPVWRQYMSFWKISSLVWVAFVLSFIFIPTARESLFRIMQFLFFLTLACALYFQLIKVRCSKCGLRIAFWEIYSSRFTLTGRCPNCGVQLKPRLLSENMATIVPLAIFIIVILIIIIAGILIKGRIGPIMKIEHHRIDVPKCGR